jgi:Gas vesicle synthesis protein GvpO
MADEETSAKRRRRKPDKEPSEGDSDGTRRSRERRLSGAEVAQLARRELADVTGLDAESATSLERGQDGGWIVTVELLELSRLPDTDDLLGLYEVELDDDGELLAYRRIRRYARSQAGENEVVRER